MTGGSGEIGRVAAPSTRPGRYPWRWPGWPPIDVRIIRAPHENARSPLSRIAAPLGLPESTVRHRLNRRVERGMIELAAMVNPLRLGSQIWAPIHIEVELSRIRSVALLLASPARGRRSPASSGRRRPASWKSSSAA